MGWGGVGGPGDRVLRCRAIADSTPECAKWQQLCTKEVHERSGRRLRCVDSVLRTPCFPFRSTTDPEVAVGANDLWVVAGGCCKLQPR